MTDSHNASSGGVPLMEIAAFVNDYLRISDYSDASMNGLQVQGERDRVSRIVTGVTANVALFEAARQRNADLVMTHHGLYWKGADPRLTGVLGQRVRALSGMSLMAWHLPLDGHPELGNNALLAKMLGARNAGYLSGSYGSITVIGEFENPVSAEQIRSIIIRDLGREPFIMGPQNHPIRKIAICSGGGGFVLGEDLPPDTDAVFTGEVQEHHYHLAVERGITAFVAGHHATERCGIRALGEFTARHFGIEAEFVDIPSPL